MSTLKRLKDALASLVAVSNFETKQNPSRVCPQRVVGVAVHRSIVSALARRAVHVYYVKNPVDFVAQDCGRSKELQNPIIQGKYVTQ